jgi:hypothetical protein
MYALGLMLIATAALADDATPEERPHYCDEPIYIMRGEPETHESPRDEELLNAEEASDPDLAQSLAATPGPYGHSELGFRYLARVFGYPGKFTTREAVEAWLVTQEAEGHARKKGLWEVWEHWVVNANKRLSVPRGAVNALPRNGDPDMFFIDNRDRMAHARCVKVEIATKLCENYYGRNRKMMENDVVHFAGTNKGAEKFGYCQVTLPPWRIAQEKRQAEEWNKGVGKPEGAHLMGGDSSGGKTAQ